MSEIVEYFEIVLNPCEHIYGSSPCTAAVGVTGDFKCYNSPRTCQDPPNYSAGDEQILRLAVPSSSLDAEIEAIPCIKEGGITRRPFQANPGEGLGVRESVTVSMHNFKHNDVGLDKYVEERGFNTYLKGTFWGKFFARWGNFYGYEARTVTGYSGQHLDEMVRRHYMIDSVSGPDNSGNVSFTIKDALKFIDEDKAQYPLPSSGKLLSDIDEAASTITLDPAGIGDEYPLEGLASIGSENVYFTRVGDVVTVDNTTTGGPEGRGLRGSDIQSHDAGTTFQIAASFDSETPAQILNELFLNTDMPTDYLNLTMWEMEVSQYLGRLYSADIMQPTSVKTLSEEIVREAGLVICPDLINKKINVKVLKQEVPVMTISDDNVVSGSVSSKPLSDKRVTDVWVSYGKINPLEKQSEDQNYAAVHAAITSNAVVALEQKARAIRNIYSRWITTLNQPAAQDVAERLVARYEQAPRLVSFKVLNDNPIKLGDTISIKSRIFEDAQGDPADPFNAQIISIDDKHGCLSANAEEVRFSQIQPPESGERRVAVVSDVYNINLRDVHDSIYTPPNDGDVIILEIYEGAIIGSTSIAEFSLSIGDWPENVMIRIEGGGRIQGRGGYEAPQPNRNGGPALHTRENIEIQGSIEIWSGGGVGGQTLVTTSGPAGDQETLVVGPSGGAGLQNSRGATTESGGGGYTTTVGGTPVYVAEGGGPGQDGEDGGSTSGGVAGIAIDGLSYVTFTSPADVRGPQIN